MRQWACEHAAVDPKIDGEYRMWGKYTYGSTHDNELVGKITEIDPPNVLEVREAFFYADAIARWELAAIDASTRVQLTSTLPGNTVAHSHNLNADFVELSLYNLRSFAESGVAACRAEYADRRDEMTVAIQITATPGDVWSALTVPEEMNKWISGTAVVDLQPGGIYSYGWKETVDGKEVPVGATDVVSFDPGKELVTGWDYTGEPHTQVKWQIEGSGGKTTLTLTHSGFGPLDNIEGYVQGWAAFLAKLKALLEGKSLVARKD